MLRGSRISFLDSADPFVELACVLGGARSGQTFGEFFEFLFEALGLLRVNGLVLLSPRR